MNYTEIMKRHTIQIIFLSIILPLSCCMKIKETTYPELIYPFITQTVPPPLYYYGTLDNWDYFSVPFRKYKVFKSNMDDKYRFPFVSWGQSNRIRMNVKLYEFIPQTVYESEKQNKRDFFFENRNTKGSSVHSIDNIFAE